MYKNKSLHFFCDYRISSLYFICNFIEDFSFNLSRYYIGRILLVTYILYLVCGKDAVKVKVNNMKQQELILGLSFIIQK